MATILELVAAGVLVKVDPQLGIGEMEVRQIFLLAETAIRAAELLEVLESDWDIETSPAEQLDDLFHHFTTGGNLIYPRQFHAMTHVRDGIWELKTPDLRLFGWFTKTDIYICTDIAHATTVKIKNQYPGYCEQSWFKRIKCPLDEPKFIQSRDPNDVVSNCSLR